MEAGDSALESMGNDPSEEFSHRPDFGSQNSFFANPLMTIPSSQVHPQLSARVVRPRVSPIDPQHLAAWATRTNTQPLPRTPPDEAEAGSRRTGITSRAGAFTGPPLGMPFVPSIPPVFIPPAVNVQQPEAFSPPVQNHPLSAIPTGEGESSVHEFMEFNVNMEASSRTVPGVSQLRTGDSGQEVRSALAEYLALVT
ncbi:hypothetical protein R1sor_015732 [Riccia sorocarpa]|uniref:Uncharacterized protein n=1 Tax=Riccia sorocarpa TaxID=122646 RepID=A0ABD3HDE8_9MARC